MSTRRVYGDETQWVFATLDWSQKQPFKPSLDIRV